MTRSLQQLMPAKRKPFIMAHRGNRARFPENTLAAFSQALQDGVDILETDLHLSADDQLVCIHDPTVDRTTASSGSVQDMTLQQLQSLPILDAQAQPTDLRIPALAELAAILPGDVALALELKSDRFLEQEVCLKLADVLRKQGVLQRTICLSFSLARLRSVRTHIPGLPVGWISMSRLLPDKDVDMIGVFWPLMFINPFYARQAHARGMFVCPLDPAPEPRLAYYLRMGCDAILSDDPRKTRERLHDILHKS